MTIQQELTGYLEDMQAFTKDNGQDPSAVRDHIITLTTVLARCNFLMAGLQRQNRESKKSAYLKFFGSDLQEKAKLNKVNAKDFVEVCCYQSGYLFDLAERTSRAAYHTIEALRSVLSSLKSEQQFSNL